MNTNNGWLDIASAPKDSFIFDGLHHYGTKIIVFDGSINTARWWSIEGDSASNFIDEGGRAIYPTHWMPLPAAPGTPPASAQDDAKDEQAAFEAQPYGWLYDWTHSSATGRPDEQYTGFTKDEAHAKKHDNPRAIYLSAPAAGDAQDDQMRWTLRWIMREADAAKETCSTDPESPAAIRNAKLAAIATAAAQALGLVRGPSYADPGADDAQDAARWRWIFSHAENVGFDYQSGRFTTLTIAGRQRESLVAFVDAALAASQQQEG